MVDAVYGLVGDAFLVGTNLALLICGICGDPGVPESVYLRYTKAHYAKPSQEETEMVEQETAPASDETEAPDLESTGPVQRKPHLVKQDEDEEEAWEGMKPTDYPRDYYPKRIQGKLFCQKCNVYVTRDMEHCDDCQVCVEEIDHHCVFFSKCIAKGNLFAFWGSLGMVLFNFVAIGLSVVFLGDTPLHKMK